MFSPTNALIKAAPSLVGAQPSYPSASGTLQGILPVTCIPETQICCVDDEKLRSFSDWAAIYRLMGMAGAGACAYHGWKRNGTYGWTILWSMFGATLPPVALLVAFLQGFGQK